MSQRRKRIASATRRHWDLPDTVAPPDNVSCIHAIAAKGIDGYLPDLMLRQFADKHSLVAIVGKAHRHVSLTATGDNMEVPAMARELFAENGAVRATLHKYAVMR